MLQKLASLHTSHDRLSVLSKKKRKNPEKKPPVLWNSPLLLSSPHTFPIQNVFLWMFAPPNHPWMKKTKLFHHTHYMIIFIRQIALRMFSLWERMFDGKKWKKVFTFHKSNFGKKVFHFSRVEFWQKRSFTWRQFGSFTHLFPPHKKSCSLKKQSIVMYAVFLLLSQILGTHFEFPPFACISSMFRLSKTVFRSHPVSPLSLFP